MYCRGETKKDWLDVGKSSGQHSARPSPVEGDGTAVVELRVSVYWSLRASQNPHRTVMICSSMYDDKTWEKLEETGRMCLWSMRLWCWCATGKEQQARRMSAHAVLYKVKSQMFSVHREPLSNGKISISRQTITCHNPKLLRNSLHLVPCILHTQPCNMHTMVVEASMDASTIH